MKIYKILSVALLLLVTMGTLKAQTAKDGLVWVFNGDSITDENRYSNYMEAYFHLRYPQYQMHFRSVGRGGARLNDMLKSSSGQGPHYKNRAYSFSPDVISIMYGHNDGAYSNAAWRSILNNTLDEIEANSSSDVVLLGPHPQHGGGKPYLEDFNQIFVDVGASRGYAAVDTWAALKPIWDRQSGASLGVFDGTHPGATGHACMAAALLKGLNEERLVSSATLNAANGTLTASTNATISNISTTANGITFSRLDDRLPMAFDPKSYPALDFCPDILDMNQYMLTVSGLPSGTYDVYVDGVKSASGISSSALASGWNMTQMSKGPIYDQLNDVINAIRDKQGIGRTSLDRVGPPWKGIERYISSVKSDSGSYSSMISSTVNVRAELDAFDVVINNLAQPVQRNFELRRSGAAPTEYRLTTNAVNGRVSPAGGTYSSGVSVALTAIPDEGYVFDRWSGDATGSTAYTQITINNNKTVTAMFVADSTGSSSGGGSGAAYQNLAVSAITASTFEVSNTPENTRDNDLSTRWSAEGAQWISFDLGSVYTVSHLNIAFKNAKTVFDIELSTDGSNWVQVYSALSTSALTGQFEAIDFTDTAARYVRINGDGYPNSAWNSILEVDIYGNSLSSTQYTLTTQASNGSIAPTGGQFVENTQVTLIATADAGYQFDGWSANVSGSVVTMDSDQLVTALFSKIATPTPVQYSLSSSVIGQGSVSPASGFFNETSLVALTATPESGWQFDGWSANVSGNAVTMNSNQLVVATFSEIPSTGTTQYTLTTSATNGVIFPASGTFEEGSIITLTATPNANYQFDGWGGDLMGTAASIQIPMNSNMSVSASFSPTSGGFVTTAYIPPIGLPAPEFGINESVENVYGSDSFYTHYVDNAHPNATDTDNAKGSVNKPRKTIPQILAAGSVVEVRGRPYVDTRDEIVYQLNGTATAPVFIRGVSNPDRVVILGQAGGSTRTDISFQGQYFIVENFDFYNKVRLKFDSNARYGSLRNSELHNPVGFSGAMSPTLSASGEHIVIYNNEIHDNVQSASEGAHGIQASAGANKLWLLDNKIYNNGGDGFQTCQQCEINKPSNIYIGDNEFFGDRENAINLKYASDVVVSQNKLHSYTQGRSAITVGSAGTPDNVWLLFNEIYNSRMGVKVEYANDLWLIGNLIHNIEKSAISLEKQGDVRLVNNTVYNADLFVSQFWNDTFSLTAVNNIVVDMLGTQVGNHMHFESLQVYSNSTFENNLFWQSGGDVFFGLGTGNNETFNSTTALANYSFGRNNMIAGPVFVDAMNKDFRLKNNSPAIDAGRRDAVYQTFENTYGIDIRQDKKDLVRPQKTAWDIGALEYDDNPLPAPSRLSATAVSTSQINLSWTDNSTDEEGFIIEYSSDGGVNYSELTTTSPNVSDYNNTGLSESATYHYRVLSYNSVGNSAYSKSVSAKTPSGGVASSGGGGGPLNFIFLLLLAAVLSLRLAYHQPCLIKREKN